MKFPVLLTNKLYSMFFSTDHNMVYTLKFYFFVIFLDGKFEWNNYLITRSAEEVPDDFFDHVSNYFLYCVCCLI